MSKPTIEISVLIIFLPSMVFSLLRLDDERSSFLTQKENSCLKGHVIKTRTAPSFATCTQYCLTHTDCNSVNYRQSGVCELNNASPTNYINPVMEADVTLGWWINVQLEQYVFTSLGSQGQDGPTNTYGYNGTNLEGNVQVMNGVQLWTAPLSANYIIEAYGASGANGTCKTCKGWSNGGYGAKITGTFAFKQETQLRILIGQQGLNKLDTKDSPGGGGGGTFVSLADNTPLIIAGGGGGGGVPTNSVNHDGDPGQTNNNGSRYGGSNGQGGQRYDQKTMSQPMKMPPHFGGAGAGYHTDGESFGGKEAKSFLNGGKGGSGDGMGGFGGGGFPIAKSPGGGGGYSGGGVITDGGLAGGGGSYNAGSDPKSESGINKGDGLAVITLST